jgi:hypothetical protein
MVASDRPPEFSSRQPGVFYVFACSGKHQLRGGSKAQENSASIRDSGSPSSGVCAGGGCGGSQHGGIGPGTPENTIQYTSANINISGGVGSHGGFTVNLDLNGDGITDVGAVLGASGYSSGSANRSYYQAQADWFAPVGNGGIERPLTTGMEIGPNNNFVDGGLLVRSVLSHRERSHHRKEACAGPFADRTAYLGVRFVISGETQFGWVRTSITCEGTAFSGTISGYAYNTIANQPLRAGATRSGTPAQRDAAVPGTLGVLSLGSMRWSFGDPR